MSILFQTVTVGAAALTGLLPVAVLEPEVLKPILSAASPSALHAVPIKGAACKKVGQIRKTPVGSFKCVVGGKRKTWRLLPSSNTAVSAGTIIRSGSSCNIEGLRIDSSDTTLECRRVAQGSMKYFAVSPSPGPIKNPSSPEPIANCRLPDLRTSNISGLSTVYPTRPSSTAVTNRGVVNVGVIFVDFSEVNGTQAELRDHIEDVKLAADWIRWYSQGRVTYNLQFSDRWIRASRPESDYRVFIDPQRSGNQAMTNTEISTSFRAMAATTLDISTFTVLWVVHPKAIQAIDESYVDRGQFHIVNTASDTYRGKYPIWQNFIHETMHQHGLLGHAPKREQSLFGVMAMNGSPGTALNSWDSIVLDWMREENLYCVRRDLLTPVSLTLVPQEREQEGLRAAFIRLSESEALIIESHRRDKWSPRWPTGFYGITVMRADSRLDTVWNDGSSTTKYLMHSNDRFLMLEGESFTTDGITITFAKSGDNDMIEIKRSN
jgi:hypothetical protein